MRRAMKKQAVVVSAFKENTGLRGLEVFTTFFPQQIVIMYRPPGNIPPDKHPR